MRVSARGLWLGGLGAGFVFAAAGATVFWMQDRPDAFQEAVGLTPVRVERPAERVTRQDLEILKAEIERLKGNSKGDGADVAWFPSEMNHELALLRSQLAQLTQRQDSIIRDIDEITSVGLERLKKASGHGEAAASELTPEEKLNQENAQTLAHLEWLEQALLAETVDPAWASSAQHALDQTLQNENMEGLTLMGKECRATLCRLELQLDRSAFPEKSFHRLARLSPWQGAGFYRIDTNGYAVVYLAREGHALPQSQ